jgi:hypothetical protein
MKNKKGSVFLGLGLGIFIFIMGVLILPYIADDVTSFRTSLDCSNSGSISDGTKITCLFGGALVPYYIWFFSSLAVGLIIGGSKG